MKLYADHRPLAARQAVGDLLLLVWVWAWVRIGQHLTSLVDRLAEPGRTLERAGTTLEDGLDAAAGGVDRLPLVGGALEDIFDDTAGAGRSLRAAGAEQAQAAHDLAVAVGLVVAGLAIVWALSRYLPARLRWVRDASAVAGLVEGATDLRLFALRAVANRPLAELARVSADPAGDLAAGRYEDLAALELTALGLGGAPRPSAEVGGGPTG